eukprot:TRINITY_DN3063_c0_g1_i2.p1 TRINITY_DN3063_c0_g1~~TRINITY_DN3063_c0_g1_i2.p1  ORF type:complete len:860 (+),score=140.04 TRINITY_DN3063_c0_g1_i2:213-2582(+)
MAPEDEGRSLLRVALSPRSPRPRPASNSGSASHSASASPAPGTPSHEPEGAHKSCHICRRSHLEGRSAVCCNVLQRRDGIPVCRRRFCYSCLTNRCGIRDPKALDATTWVCPFCSGTCVCAECRSEHRKVGSRTQHASRSFPSLSSMELVCNDEDLGDGEDDGPPPPRPEGHLTALDVFMEMHISEGGDMRKNRHHAALSPRMKAGTERRCHLCHQVKETGMVFCRNVFVEGPSGIPRCRRRFCAECLRTKLLDTAPSDDDPYWTCPVCRGECLCESCRAQMIGDIMPFSLRAAPEGSLDDDDSEDDEDEDEGDDEDEEGAFDDDRRTTSIWAPLPLTADEAIEPTLSDEWDAHESGSSHTEASVNRDTTGTQSSGVSGPRHLDEDLEPNKSCHSCRRSHLNNKSLVCSNSRVLVNGQPKCRKRYCYGCLLRRHQVPLSVIEGNGVNWICPHCQGTCRCTEARRSGMLQPPVMHAQRRILPDKEETGVDEDDGSEELDRDQSSQHRRPPPHRQQRQHVDTSPRLTADDTEANRTCHICRRSKTDQQSIVCANSGVLDHGKAKCKKRFCFNCLLRRQNLDQSVLMRPETFVCPFCQGNCVCSDCQAGVQTVGGPSETRAPTFGTPRKKLKIVSLGSFQSLELLASVASGSAEASLQRSENENELNNAERCWCVHVPRSTHTQHTTRAHAHTCIDPSVLLAGFREDLRIHSTRNFHEENLSECVGINPVIKPVRKLYVQRTPVDLVVLIRYNTQYFRLLCGDEKVIIFGRHVNRKEVVRESGQRNRTQIVQ